MAYAAATSLYHRIHHLLNSSRTSVASSTKKILKSAGRAAKRLQRTLEKYDTIKNSSEGVMAVDARIRDEACRLEDAIESEASAQFLPQSESHGRLYLNLHHLRHDIDCFVQTVKKMRAEYMEELYKKEEIVSVVSSTTCDSHGNDCDMVGLSDMFLHIRDFLARDYLTHRLHSVEIIGMACMGKTALAKKLFHDSLVKENFDCQAFVKVGQKYEFEEILRAIVAQLNVDRDQMVMEGDENISQYFTRSLRGKKFLIVLDDVWDVNFDRCFTGLLPEHCDESVVLITGRIEGTFKDIRYCSWRFKMRFLNEEESWELLRRKVFGEGGEGYYCPPQLVKAGKKIAENCEGLPLLIVTIAQLLFEAPKNPEYWDKVAKMQNSVFEDACNQIYEVLLSSYHYMTQNSKACFLYMGVFPKNYVVRRSRIINLWRVERFADGVGSVLDYIVSINLVVLREYRFRIFYEAKACNLHVVYRYLTKREGENNKLFHILNSNGYDSIEGIKVKRRLAIYHNTLLAIKEVHNSIASCVSTLRSVLCTGPYHQYQVPICWELKLLRVLDAFTVRFYEFPTEVVNLIQLRYLSLTTNVNLPPSIRKLWFLQYLIVHQHLSVKRSLVESSYVPVEIWELQELDCLQIIGRNLPHPPPGAILPNLTRLLDVGVQSCTKEVLESIPNLEKLRVQIELAPVAPQNLSCFDHISLLEKLVSLRAMVMNPKLLPKPIAPPRLLSIYSSCLQKLSLNGFGYPWKDMSKIAELPCLEVLKLQCYAFRGEKWDAKEMRFLRLEYLLIEDTDLEKWTAADETFTCLRWLTMKNCYKLREISQLNTLYQIKLVDCNLRVETWAKKKDECGVTVKYSWQ